MIEQDTIFFLIGVGVVVCPLIPVVYMVLKPNTYMEEQKNFNSDKVILLNAMQTVMEAEYTDFSYVAGYYFKHRYESYSYILAFRPGEIIAMQYRMNSERIQITESFSAKIIHYKIRQEDVILTVSPGGRKKIKITVPKVLDSRGYRHTCFPLGIYQSDEVDHLCKFISRMI